MGRLKPETYWSNTEQAYFDCNKSIYWFQKLLCPSISQVPWTRQLKKLWKSWSVHLNKYFHRSSVLKAIVNSRTVTVFKFQKLSNFFKSAANFVIAPNALTYNLVNSVSSISLHQLKFQLNQAPSVSNQEKTSICDLVPLQIPGLFEFLSHLYCIFSNRSAHTYTRQLTNHYENHCYQ